MPIYLFEHLTENPDCDETLELYLGMDETPSLCPKCNSPIRKLVASFSHHKNVLSSSNIKEKGFTRLRRRDKGVYEPD